MTKAVKTRVTQGHEYRIFAQRAHGARHAAGFCLEQRHWDVAVFNAVQAVVSASDALCAYYLKKRYAGPEHVGAAKLLLQLPLSTKEANALVERFYRVVRLKTIAAYEGSVITEKQARQVMIDSERFLEVLKTKVPEESISV